jgi:ABC-type sugar transport system substrate-binding protein
MQIFDTFQTPFKFILMINFLSISSFAVLLILSIALPCRAEKPEYAFILKARGNPFWKSISDGIKDALNKEQINGLIYQIDEDRNSESQLNLCNTVIQKKPAIIVLGAVTTSVGIECYKNATAQGIKIADIDGNVTVLEAQDMGVPLSFSVGSNNFLIGESAASYLHSINKKDAPRIFIIEGLAGNSVSKKRVDGFRTKISSLIPKAHIVASIAGDWDRLKAATITTDILTKEPSLDFIFSASDLMTYGIIESVKVAKRGEVKIISVDAQAQILNSVKSGKLLATVAQLPYLMGTRSVTLAVKAVTENLSNVSEYTDTPVVTKEFLEVKNNPTLQYLR